MNPEAQQQVREAELKEAGEGSPSFERLPLLYQGLLTGIVRVKAGRQHLADAESFRRRTKGVLHDIEQVAIAGGYDASDVRDTHFAVVAFLDSVLLNSNEPVRAEWERKPLQEELFGQTDAGVVFFDKLEHFRSRRDSDRLADILEVYLLCLFLGFEGRYSGRLRGELESITEKLRLRIDHIRGRSNRISPSAAPSAPAGPVAFVRKDPLSRARAATLAALIVTIFCFIALKLYLVSAVGSAIGRF